jgi:hypothetical protein
MLKAGQTVFFVMLAVKASWRLDNLIAQDEVSLRLDFNSRLFLMHSA